MSDQALRYNQDKLCWHNFPMFLIRPLAKVGHYGEKKYERYNFLKGAPISQYMDSCKRHIDAFEDPNQSDLDAESGLPHLAHAAWNLLVAVWVMENKPELDDRYSGELKQTPADLSYLLSGGRQNTCVSQDGKEFD